MTGIELIAEERRQQIEKHCFNEAHDDQYLESELLNAALFVLTMDDSYWPKTWEKEWMNKIICKPRIEQYAVAGALIAAHMDRTQRAS